MRTLELCGFAFIAAMLASPAAGQFGGRISAEPYVAYGFFGGLGDSDRSLEADIAFGGRVAYSLTPQWAAFGNFQRSTPALIRDADDADLGELNVDHWSAGVEFSYVPRVGAEGMLPILLEAGLGQARYDGDFSDLAVNIGLASAFQLTPNFAVRYGANDYISNFGEDQGIVNQIFVRIGAEFAF